MDELFIRFAEIAEKLAELAAVVVVTFGVSMRFSGCCGLR